MLAPASRSTDGSGGASAAAPATAAQLDGLADEPGVERWVHLPCTVCRRDWRVMRLTDPQLGLSPAAVAMFRHTWSARYALATGRTPGRRMCIALQAVAILAPLAVIIWAIWLMASAVPAKVGR
jgi:hypothetical protein